MEQKRGVARPKLQFSVPCLDVENSDSGSLSLRNIIFELGIKSDFPYELSYFYIVNCWCSGTGHNAQTLQFLSPDGTELMNSGSQPLDFARPDSSCLIANKLQSVVLPQPGQYRIRVYLGDELALEYPIRFYEAQTKA